MSDEEPQQQSIQARIAALNLGQVGRAPFTANTPKPPLDHRPNSVNVPVVSSQNNGIGNEPRGQGKGAVLPPPVITRTGQKPAPAPKLPPRKPSTQQTQLSPPLPARRPSDQLSRRDSMESISSVISTNSSVFSNGMARTPTSRAPSMDGGRLLAPVYDPSTLPPLPPKRSQQDKEKDLEKIMANGKKTRSSVSEIISPQRTPALPQRPAARDQPTEPPPRKLPPRDPPPMPTRPLPPPTTNGVRSQSYTNGNGVNPTPPPIPLSSRPDLSKIMATKPKMSNGTAPVVPAASNELSCLICRDFSGPDNHAAKFPRQNVPSLDWLASQLTDPFPSLTDKARAIFAWLHYNIDYNVEAFFAKNVQSSTPASTLQSGLAVCEGYAGLYTALATKAGLESIVISGHGKGFGHDPLPAGAPCPPEFSTHAWSVVKIDGGKWKLLDPCWGAGNVSNDQKYNRAFDPYHFITDNDEFGLRHFPTNRAHQYRDDGRTVSWEEYFLSDAQTGEQPVLIYKKNTSEEGISHKKFVPNNLKISLSPAAHAGPTVRFQFEKICPHWDPIKKAGKPWVYLLATGIGADGRAKDYIPFDTNTDSGGMFWWVDVPPAKLGAPGEKVMVYYVTQRNGNSARGLTKEEYLMSKGKPGSWAFGIMGGWELV